MKKILIFLFCILPLSVHAKSDCGANETNCWDCGKTENDLCTARKSGNNLTITGAGEMRDYNAVWSPRSSDTPWGPYIQNVSVQGVKNIGKDAFAFTSVKTVNIADSVKKIGSGAFHVCPLQSLNIPDSVTKIEGTAFFNVESNNSAIRSSGGFFVPESVTEVGTVHNNVGIVSSFGDTWGQAVPLYCSSTTPCINAKIYTKDENGVYKIDGAYYASPDDVLSKNSCGSGQAAPQNCIDAAAAYQQQKAAQMAGGALCKTQADCLKLIEMSNKKTVCSSIADCKEYGRENGLGFGHDFWLTNPDGSRTHYDGDNHILGFKNKRIYTVEEASIIASPKGNTFKLKYR